LYLGVLIPDGAPHFAIIVRSRWHFLFLYYRVDFRDVSSGELDHSGFSLVGLIRGYEDTDAAAFRLSERVRQIRHFISNYFPAVRIREVTVGDEHGQLSELRFDPYSPIGFREPTEFDARCARFIRDEIPAGKREKAGDKCIRSVLRDIDSILWNSLERGIRWRGGVPVQLHVHATRPLNDCVSANRIVEGSDEDIRARGLGSTDRLVHISDQIACALQPKWIRNRRLESEYGYGACRSHDQLGHGGARCRSYGENALLGC